MSIQLRHGPERSRAPRPAFGALLLLWAVALCAGGCVGWLEGGGQGGVGAASSREAAAGLPENGPPVLMAESSDLMAEASQTAPVLRVGLEQGTAEVSVSCDGPMSVRLFGEEAGQWSAERGGSWTFRAAGDGVEGHGDGGSFPPAAGTVRVSASGVSTLAFRETRYRGEIEVFVLAPGALAVANVVDVESYLRGVVPKEIGQRPFDEMEAVKAQAVAARTYAIASGGKRAEGSFDVFPTVEDQVYAGVDAEDPVSDRAIAETAGIIAEWLGEPISAYFHANCGGRTEGREEVWELPPVPYLKAVWDTPGGSSNLGSAYCFDGPNFTWEESWSGSEILDLVREHLPETASTPVRGEVTSVRALRVSQRTPSGRVRWLEVETNLGTHRVFGDRVRWLLRRPGTGRILRSAWFDLDVDARGGRVDHVAARGRGYGHGVGMCQHGALEMSREGRSYEEILKHYYPGIELARDYGGPADGE